VIDIGLPGTVDNADLPTFYIPCAEGGGLGNDSDSYGFIRLRVNKGASLVIEADNSGYPNSASTTGKFKDGCVEVMPGGKLRDGAYEGFPLGPNAVILNRAGSYLAVGPADTQNKYYTGWLIGPSGSGANAPRIVWDNAQGYIEVRPGALAISADVTVKKSLGLIYDVWFIDGPTVTIDAKDDNDTDPMPSNLKGLFANGKDYKFYGNKEANKTATIIVKQGSTLHNAFLTLGDTDWSKFITASSGNITITNAGANGNSKVYPGTAISGYLSWTGYPTNNP
jgi:hypothetical protein